MNLQSRRVIKTIEDNPDILSNLDVKLIYSPIHKKIIHFAKLLYEHKLPVNKNYLVDAIRSKAKNSDLVIAEIEDIHKNDYFIAGDVNSLLRAEYEACIFQDITNIMARDDLENDQKLRKIDKLVSGISQDIKLVEINEVLNKIVERVKDPNGEILKRIKITDNRLKEIFGDYIYSSPYVFAGRPGKGKTTLLIDLEAHLSRIGYHGLHFSLEDSKEIYGVKYASAFNNIKKKELLDGTIHPKKLEVMNKIRPQGKLHIYDRMVDSNDIRRIIKEHIRDYPLDYVALDYIQLVRTNGISRVDSLGEYSMMVMEVCKEYEIPFFHTAQLNRLNEGGKPMLGNIKDCGQIEQDARYLYALWQEKGHEESSSVHLAGLKDSTKGIFDKTLQMDFEVGVVNRVYNFSPKNQNGNFFN